ncbi:MAG: hypothetical protein AAF432_10640 [Planctomycetota bacterium]
MEVRRTILTLLIVTFGVVLFITPMIQGQSLTDDQRHSVLADAEQAYQRGIEARREQPAAATIAFREAAQRYQLLLDDGVVNGPLCVNLGNAYVQSGALGRGIHAYRLAEELTPGDDRLQRNLAHARGQRRTTIDATGAEALLTAMLGWTERVSTRARAVLFVVVYIPIWIMWLAARRWPAVRMVAIGCAVLAFIFGLTVLRDVLTHRAPGDVVGADAVLVAREVTLRKGDGYGFDAAFEEALTEGVECTIIEVRGAWANVELPNQATGWLPREAIAAVILPDARVAESSG